MKCFHCSDLIVGKPRYAEVLGERVPFCPATYATISKDCLNDYSKTNRVEHQSNDTYALNFRSQLG